MEWIRGVDKGNGQRQWVKGMESALFNAKATRCGGCAAAGGVSVAFMALWNNGNLHLFHLFHSSLLLDYG